MDDSGVVSHGLGFVTSVVRTILESVVGENELPPVSSTNDKFGSI